MAVCDYRQSQTGRRVKLCSWTTSAIAIAPAQPTSAADVVVELADTTNLIGHRRLGVSLGALAYSIVLLLVASSASAATLNVSGGQLLGASGVIVDGSSYNVEFLDGSCITLYGGCDDVSDFTFQTSAAASLASQALLDQVFLDGAFSFDTDPELTDGCTSIFQCSALTPFGLVPLSVTTVRALNVDESGSDLAGTQVDVTATSDLSSSGFNVYAVWTPVPEPGTALLMGLGLLVLSARKRSVG